MVLLLLFNVIQYNKGDVKLRNLLLSTVSPLLTQLFSSVMSKLAIIFINRKNYKNVLKYCRHTVSGESV